jgi:hypothetical protein
METTSAKPSRSPAAGARHRAWFIGLSAILSLLLLAALSALNWALLMLAVPVVVLAFILGFCSPTVRRNTIVVAAVIMLVGCLWASQNSHDIQIMLGGS